MDPCNHIYCDESCHLEHDRQQAMVLGALTCPASHRAALSRKIKILRKQYGLSTHFEIKWTKVSPGLVDFYLALVDLFFAESMLNFRSVVVPDKNALAHVAFGQTHDDFYYKMWGLLLNRVIDNQHQFQVFLDIKDTQGGGKIKKLHHALCHTHNDLKHNIILNVQLVHSHHVPFIQLTDLLIGALSHFHRNLTGSTAKQAIINRIKMHSGHDLLHSTPPQAQKFNVFVWTPQAIR